MRPLLVVEDLLVGKGGGLVLLPAVERRGLPIVPGDTLDLCDEDGREEVTVLALEPDRRESHVRIRIARSPRARPGVEVWPGESSSRVVLKPARQARPAPQADPPAPLRLDGSRGPRPPR